MGNCNLFAALIGIVGSSQSNDLFMRKEGTIYIGLEDVFNKKILVPDTLKITLTLERVGTFAVKLFVVLLSLLKLVQHVQPL